MKTKDKILSSAEAAEYLGVSPATLANWRSRGFPKIPYSKLGRSIRYRVSELDSYLSEHSSDKNIFGEPVLRDTSRLLVD